MLIVYSLCFVFCVINIASHCHVFLHVVFMSINRGAISAISPTVRKIMQLHIQCIFSLLNLLASRLHKKI